MKNIYFHDFVLCCIDPSPQEDFGCMNGFQDFIPNSEKCYYISNDTLRWENAPKTCNDMINMTYDVDYNSQNTKLISIFSDEENDKLNDELKKRKIANAWIGLIWSRKNEICSFIELF